MTHTLSFRTYVVNMDSLSLEAEEYFKPRSSLVEGHNNLQFCEDARYDDFLRDFDACEVVPITGDMESAGGVAVP